MTVTLSWYYLDTQWREFGPFRSDQMRAWWDHGYFSVGELLLVRLQEWKEHRRISEVYPAGKSAYFVMPPGCDGGSRHHEFIPHVAPPHYGHPARVYGSAAVAHPGFVYPSPAYGYPRAHPPPPHGDCYSPPGSPPGHPPGPGYGYGGYRGGRRRSRSRSRSRSSKGGHPSPSGGPPQSSLDRDGDYSCCQQEGEEEAEEEEEEGCFDCSDCGDSLWSTGKLGYRKPIAAPAHSASISARDAALRDGDFSCCQQEGEEEAEEEEEEEGCFDCSDCGDSLWSTGKLGYCKPIAALAHSASSSARDAAP